MPEVGWTTGVPVTSMVVFVERVDVDWRAGMEEGCGRTEVEVLPVEKEV